MDKIKYTCSYNWAYVAIQDLIAQVAEHITADGATDVIDNLQASLIELEIADQTIKETNFLRGYDNK